MLFSLCAIWRRIISPAAHSQFRAHMHQGNAMWINYMILNPSCEKAKRQRPKVTVKKRFCNFSSIQKLLNRFHTGLASQWALPEQTNMTTQVRQLCGSGHQTSDTLNILYICMASVTLMFKDLKFQEWCLLAQTPERFLGTMKVFVLKTTWQWYAALHPAFLPTNTVQCAQNGPRLGTLNEGTRTSWSFTLWDTLHEDISKNYSRKPAALSKTC